MNCFTKTAPLFRGLQRTKYSGKFALRTEPALHRRLALKALAAGESLNSCCVKALCKA